MTTFFKPAKLAVAVLLLCGVSVSAQTIPHVIGTFKTPGNQTPAQAGLRTLATIGATAVYGSVDFVPTDTAANRPSRLLYFGVTYPPQPVRAWIKSDGTLVDDYTAATGVDLVPTIGATPTGLAICATIRLAPSTDGFTPAAAWTECKQLPASASVDWGSLAVATIITPSQSYQTSNGGTVNDYENLLGITAPANPTSGYARVWFDTNSSLLQCKTSSGANCNPAGAAAFSTLAGGTNLTAAMHVGTGSSLDYTGSGTLNASAIASTVFDNAEALGKIPIGQGNGHAVWSDPLVQGVYAPGTNTSTGGIAGGAINPVLVGGSDYAGSPLLRNMKVDSTGQIYIGNFPATQPVSGTVSITANSAINEAQFGGTNVVTGGVNGSQGVGGLAASGAAKSGNPVQYGGVFNTTQPTVTTGQMVEAQMTNRGEQLIAKGVSGFSIDNTGFNVNNTPAVTQSGTWTVQQGGAPWSVSQSGTFVVAGNKTSNGAVADAANIGVLPAIANTAAPTLTDGRTASLSLTIGALLRVDGSAVTQPISAASLPLPTLAATSTKQSDGTQKTQIVDGSGNVIASTSNNLNVQCANCSGSGASAVDEATFTAASSVFGPAGGFFQTTATNNPLTTGQQGMAQMTAQRALFSNLRNASGTEIGTAANPLQISIANTGANATAVKVDGSGVTQPISGTVAATESGTWTVQPGNTANTTPWLFDLRTVNGTTVLTGGVNGSQGIGGLAASGAAKSGNPVQYGGVFNTTQPTVTTGQMVEAQMTNRGEQLIAKGVSGFSIDNTTFAATQSGTWATRLQDGSGNAISSTSTNLNVQCANCSGSGASAVDEAAFTAASSVFGPFGGFFQTTATNNALTNGQQGMAQFTAQRALFTNLRNASGTEIGTASNPLQISIANTGANATAVKVDGSAVTQPVSGTVSVTGCCGITDNSAFTVGTTGVNAMGAYYTSGAAPAITSGNVGRVLMDANGALKVDVVAGGAGGGLAQEQVQNTLGTYTCVGYGPNCLNVPVQEQNSGAVLNALLNGNLGQLAGVKLGRPAVYGQNPGLVNVLGVNAFVTNLPALNLNAVNGVNFTGQVAGSLPVTIVSGAGSGGTASADAATFTPGSTNGTLSNCFFQTTSANNPLTNLQGGSVQCTARRAPFVNIDAIGGTAPTTAGKLDVKGADGDIFVRQTTAANFNATVVGTGTFAVQATDNVTQFGGVNLSTGVGASGTGIPRVTVANDSNILATQSGTWSVRNQDGAGNALTSNSSTYTAKFALDGNILGTLGTAFSTPGFVDIKGADGNVFVRQTTAANLNATVVGTGTFGVQASQSGNWTDRIVGNAGGILDFAGQNAASPASALLGGCQFNTAPTAITNGNASPLQCTNGGALLVSGSSGGGVAQNQVQNTLGTYTCVGYGPNCLNVPVQEQNSGAIISAITNLIATVKTDRVIGSLGQPIGSVGDALKIYNTSTDPCFWMPKTDVAISQTAITKLVSAGPFPIHICKLRIDVGAAEVTSVVDGTGSNCGTSQVAHSGSTTAAFGEPFAANGGFQEGGNGVTVYTIPSGKDFCVLESGANRVSGSLQFVYAP